MRHTPGNWTYDVTADEVVSDIDEHGLVVCTIESNDADGWLIAQAPALLEVAELVEQHAQHGIPEGVLRAAVIALARVRRAS